MTVSLSNVIRAMASTHPLDELRIREATSRALIGPLSRTDNERLWRVFSEDRHAGDGWLPVTGESLADFADWLNR